MCKKPNLNKKVSITLQPLVLLAACTGFVQPPAPVEDPWAKRPSVQKDAEPAENKSNVVAVATPYIASAPPQTQGKVGSDAKTYVVQPGDTLFRIGLNNGLKYQDIAQWNNLPDFSIQVGKTLRLTPPENNAPPPEETRSAAPSLSTKLPRVDASGNIAVKQCPSAIKLPYSPEAVKNIRPQSEGKCADLTKRPAIAQESSAPSTLKKREASATVVVPAKPGTKQEIVTAPPKVKPKEEGFVWVWPTEGKVLRPYSQNNKGLDIGGQSGQSVVAAAAGKVVYSGNGLRGYGNLIIIKHNKAFLSAYANNSHLLVKEGQAVKQGQKIAEMGNTDADRVKLHFEIRHFGKPVDPMQYLESKP